MGKLKIFKIDEDKAKALGLTGGENVPETPPAATPPTPEVKPATPAGATQTPPNNEPPDADQKPQETKPEALTRDEVMKIASEAAKQAVASVSAKIGHVPEVAATPPQKSPENTNQDDKARSIESLKAEFANDPKIQEQFGSADSYAAYHRAVAEGRVGKNRFRNLGGNS